MEDQGFDLVLATAVAAVGLLSVARKLGGLVLAHFAAHPRPPSLDALRMELKRKLRKVRHRIDKRMGKVKVVFSDEPVLPPENSASLNAGAHRRLRRYCQRSGKCLLSRGSMGRQGDLVEATVTLVGPNDLTISRTALGRSKREASDNAAAEVLDVFPVISKQKPPATSTQEQRGIMRKPSSLYKELEVSAMVGDACLDLLITMIGAEKRLSCDAIDHVRQTVVSNKALSHGEGRKLATKVESIVGEQLMANKHLVMPFLEDAVGPELTLSIRSGLEHVIS